MTILEQVKERNNKVLGHLTHEFNNIRTGRANPQMLDDIHIDYYGTETPLNQLAQISVVEGTQLVIKAFDASTYKEIEKAINKSPLGLPVQNDGTCIRLNIPKLTADRRKELAKQVSKLAEDAKVQIRNHRRDANDLVKKDKEMPEDLQKDQNEKIQKTTDEFIIKVDNLAKDKTNEITTI